MLYIRELFLLAVMIDTQVSSCSHGVPCFYSIQIKGCSKCRNINYRYYSLSSFISELLYTTFVLCVCWNAWLPSPRLREDGFPHSVQIKFIWVNVEFYPALLMYESH